MPAAGGVAQHGTEARYRLGCRCAKCRKASTDARARRRSAKGIDDGTVAPRPIKQLPIGGPVEQSVRAALGSIDDLDVWKMPLAEAAIAAAKKIDDGSATAPLYQQMRDLLELVKGEETGASGLAGLAAIGGSRGRLGA